MRSCSGRIFMVCGPSVSAVKAERSRIGSIDDVDAPSIGTSGPLGKPRCRVPGNPDNFFSSLPLALHVERTVAVMTRRWTLVLTAVAGLAGAAACRGARVEELLATYDGYRAQVCACPDLDCVVAVQPALDRWLDGVRAELDRLPGTPISGAGSTRSSATSRPASPAPAAPGRRREPACVISTLAMALTDYEKYIRTDELLGAAEAGRPADLPRRAAVPGRPPGRRAVDEAGRARAAVAGHAASAKTSGPAR